ncbi:DNA polymerase III subunit delta' [Coleofasciculus sp. FACHB-64]|uniref:DNA polymerase III subunit delta' n=1 Tax=Cyanophyceae TaxID=3028117 RepID=UPI0016828341|nr:MULTISPECIES: DNA polymerase III subunit delta' [unclassified Coleofasciculus]MBD1839126.1 DNA polymerase III subunit delta' [Coleofasciculus sp. FACHB-501]MBD2047562.1 DNA polymerase III subunit delta' [Coleofasciculus sp. FACHB-64]
MNFFAELVGQNRAVELLTQAVAQNRIAPAYLFAGPEGVGRSMAARCFVDLLFCANVPATEPDAPESPVIKEGSKGSIASIKNRLRQGNHPDLFWVQPTYLHQGQRLSAAEAAEAGVKRKAPPQIRLEQIREITQFLGRSALEAPRSLVVLEQAETMAEAAANALLKTLEEPGRATLVLIAPTQSSLLPTLVSRCQHIPFYGLDSAAMEQVLRKTGHEEILEHPTVLAIAQGSPGNAIASWEQLQTIPQDLLQDVIHLPKSLRDALELAKRIDKTLDTEAQLWLVDYLQHTYWQQFLNGVIHKLPLQQLEKARQSLLSYAQPRLVWEVTLLEMI